MDTARFIAALESLQGTPWHHQGRTRAGLDCVGLVIAALADQGVRLDVPANYHRTAAAAMLKAWLDSAAAVRAVPDIGAGRLLVFRVRRQAQHIAVALGADRMIHAVRGAGVCAVTLSPLWRERLLGVYELQA